MPPDKIVPVLRSSSEVLSKVPSQVLIYVGTFRSLSTVDRACPSRILESRIRTSHTEAQNSKGERCLLKKVWDSRAKMKTHLPIQRLCVTLDFGRLKDGRLLAANKEGVAQRECRGRLRPVAGSFWFCMVAVERA